MNAISAYLTTLAFYAQQRLGKATKGATAVEYGLLVALIAAVIITIVATLGTTIQGTFTTIVDKLKPVAPVA
jgi:pilus assembly protein Flp/PilA